MVIAVAVTIFGVGLIPFLTWLLYIWLTGGVSPWRRRRILETGISAMAVVVDVDVDYRTSWSGFRGVRRLVNLVVDVHPEGAPSFRRRIRQLLDASQRGALDQGSRLPCRVDRGRGTPVLDFSSLPTATRRGDVRERQRRLLEEGPGPG